MEKGKAISFQDLSWPVKAALLGGWISLISFIVGFVLGFTGAA